MLKVLVRAKKRQAELQQSRRLKVSPKSASDTCQKLVRKCGSYVTRNRVEIKDSGACMKGKTKTNQT